METTEIVEIVETHSSGVGGTSANSGTEMTDGSSSSPGAFFMIPTPPLFLDHHQILLGMQ